MSIQSIKLHPPKIYLKTSSKDVFIEDVLDVLDVWGNESSQASYPGTSHLFLLGAQLNHFAPAWRVIS